MPRADLSSKLQRRAAYTHHLDTMLLDWGRNDVFTLGQACQGVKIFGGTGSGKTSGSGRALAQAYLQHGFGGLVLCAKPDEVSLWQNYTREAGRDESVLRVGGGTTEGEAFQEQKDFKVDPAEFSNRLRTGGQGNDCQVDAIVVQPGRRFSATAEHYRTVTFRQDG